MEPVVVVFSRSKKIFSRLICLVTWSKWSHVGLVHNNSIIEAVGSGVRQVTLEEFHHDKREVIFVTYYVKDKAAVISFAQAQLGKKYDFSALIGILFKRNWGETTRWFCSELVAAALDSAGSSPFRRGLTGRITPNDLWMVNPERTCI